MEIEVSNNEIRFERELNELDKLTIDFTDVLNSLDVSYVVVSGYVSILFGRSRASEDIDILIEKIDHERFLELWGLLEKRNFECINTTNANDAFASYLSVKHAIRFARKEEFEPNVEIKFPKIELERLALQERIKVLVNNRLLYVSPLELQIAFKLSLGSEKDIEDAKHLYNVFEGKLDRELLAELNRKLQVVELFDKYLEK